MKLSFKNTIPLLIGAGVAFIVYLAVGWWGFLFLGFWIGGWITAREVFWLPAKRGWAVTSAEESPFLLSASPALDRRR
jgi:hypothetical protein